MSKPIVAPGIYCLSPNNRWLNILLCIFYKLFVAAINCKYMYRLLFITKFTVTVSENL